MKTLAFTLVLILSSVAGFGQKVYRMTFQGTGDASHIDWIQATNMTSGISVTFPGDETLKLIYLYPEPGSNGVTESLTTGVAAAVYPNPFRGSANVTFPVGSPQVVSVSVTNMTGQVVALTDEYAEAGQNRFILSVAADGVYMVTLTSREGSTTIKAVCNGSGGENAIRSAGFTGNNPGREGPGIKSAESGYEMYVGHGERIVYRCVSGDNTTLFTDLPAASKMYRVRFTACRDKQGRNYPVVDVKGQTWMAENLAYLPSVSSSYEGAVTRPYYYVYGYQGRDVKRAMKSATYEDYGVLYNWTAARSVCPEGWKLPSDADWKKLEKNLGMDIASLPVKGWRLAGEVGCKLKETGSEHWTVGNNRSTDEIAFTARPGGVRLDPAPATSENDGIGDSLAGPFGTFANLGSCGIYWTSSVINPGTAWNRRFGCVEGGIERMTMSKTLGLSVRCIKDRPEE